MSNILYMAISSDGFIADSQDQTPWSDDEWAEFREFARSCDYILLGRRTYEIMRDNGEFVDGPQYIVVTSAAAYDADGLATRNITTARDMPKTDGIVGIIGGGELNGRLAKLGVIDELILDIEPITLGSGIRLFGKYDIPLKLELLDSKAIGQGTIQRHYKLLPTPSNI